MLKYAFLGLFLTHPIFTVEAQNYHGSAFSPNPPAIKSRILNVMHKDDAKLAFSLYRDYCKQMGKQDFELLQQLCLTLLEQGTRSSDPEIALLTLYGAGISANEKMIPILADAISSPIPQLQLIALHFLAELQNDEADAAMKKALSSPMLLTRLEAVHYLALRKSPIAADQAEALMHKLDSELRPIFPSFFISIGTPRAMKLFRQLLNDCNERVRIEAILAAAEKHRDDLSGQIRKLATHHSYAQQEACAFALGSLRDESAGPQLEALTRSTNPQVRITAAWALKQIGNAEKVSIIEDAAKSGDPFAIALLGSIEGSENLLYGLTKNDNIHIRLNASIALLELEDSRCIAPLMEVVIHDARDLAFAKVNSPGHALTCWRAIPSAQHNLSENQIAIELSNRLREAIITKIADINSDVFLQVAELVFKADQNELVPIVVALLENIRSPDAINLLKSHQQKLGSPFIRHFCNLALFRMKIPGPYGDNVRRWIAQQHQEDLIKLRPFVPLELRGSDAAYQLSPEETSGLLVQSFEALAQAQDEESIEVLLRAIHEGNAKNKYALAGLLLRAIQ